MWYPLQHVRRRTLALGLCLVLVLALCSWAKVAWGEPPSVERALVWADADDWQSSPQLADSRVVADLGEQLVVEIFAGLAIQDTWSIADPRPWTGPTYLVCAPADLIEPLPTGVAHASRGPGCWWLVRGAREAVEVLAVRGASIVVLTPDELPAGRDARREPLAQELQPSPEVATLVAMIDEAEIYSTLQDLQDFGTRYSYTAENGAATNYLVDRFTELGLQVELDPFLLGGKMRAAGAVPGNVTSNVVATHLGTDRPDEIYIVCGHFDSTSEMPYVDAPGADDNGSGAAAVVEIARVLSARPFEATVLFICFNGEEQGLVGSKHYVQNVVEPSNMDVRGVINLDMIGFVHPMYPTWDANIYCDEGSTALGQQFARCVSDYSTCDDHIVQSTNPVYGSDHFWFAQYGYPAVFGIDAKLWGAPDWNPFYHSTADRIETLHFGYLTEFTRGAAAVVAELAVPREAMATGPDPLPTDLPRLAVGPTPTRSGTTFRWPGGQATITIVDALGRRVAGYTGSAPWTWDGRATSAGSAVASGTYWYQLHVDGSTTTGRIVWLR